MSDFSAEKYIRFKVPRDDSIPVGTTSATVKINYRVPYRSSVQNIYDIGSTGVVANDTNYWTWSVTNKGQDGSGSTAVLASSDANTTKATGGSAVTANVARTLTLHGTQANLELEVGDVLEIILTKTASATTREGVNIMLQLIGR